MILKINILLKSEYSKIKRVVPLLFDRDLNVIDPVLYYVEYLLKNKKSESTIKNRIDAIYLFFKYLNAIKKEKIKLNEQEYLEYFITILSSGSINEYGEDRLGLYWMPISTERTKVYLDSLTDFGDWFAIRYQTNALNPFRKVTRNEKNNLIAQWSNVNKKTFLAHIKRAYINEHTEHVRNILVKEKVTVEGSIKYFSEEFFLKLITTGFSGKRQSKVTAMRDMLILLLIHGAGLRESEAINIWVNDVDIKYKKLKLTVDEEEQLYNVAFIKIYDEEKGYINDKKYKFIKTRGEYLRRIYNREPRLYLSGKDRVGMKSRKYPNDDYSFDVYFYPPYYGVYFANIWNQYILHRLLIENVNPYAFVNFSKNYNGEPYKLSTFNKNYKRILNRIGLKQNKKEGLSPHSHRHSYGKRLKKDKFEESMIMKMMHHSNLDSQKVYTELSPSEARQKLEQKPVYSNDLELLPNFVGINLLKGEVL